VVVAGGDLKRFFASYLFAYMFFLSIALGGLFFVLLHYATRAGWSVVVRRVAENVMGTLPVLAILFIPIALKGLDQLYEWVGFEHEVAQARAVSADAVAQVLAAQPVLAQKMGYLSTDFFRIRAILYFAVWIFLSWHFRRRSLAQDVSGDRKVTRALQWQSAPSLLAFGLTLTFASFDWLMSLNPHWYSTIFGVYYFAGTVIAIHAFLILATLAMRRGGLLKDVITNEHYHDLGKMLFAFIVFWTYIAFSQYMLYWYANIPEETVWFGYRWQGPWKLWSVLLGVGHFAVPFFFLMSRHIKRRPALLAAGAIWMLLMQLADMYWLVMPTFYSHAPLTTESRTAYSAWDAAAATAPFGLIEVLVLLGLGGLFLAAFAWNVRRAALIPLRDPRLPESLAFENF
jgi:hypothetical protein